MKPETRKKIEKFILTTLDKVDPSKTNSGLYKQLFTTMTDGQLEALIRQPVPIYAPNGSQVKLDHMRNIEICRELGYDPEQYCWLTDPKTGATSRTKYKHLVLPQVVRRQTQLIDKKASIPEHSRTIDKSTGQATGASKGSSFSFPQVFVMFTKGGYDQSIRELIKIRGGDNKARQIIDREIRLHGSASQKFEGSDRTRTKSLKFAGNLFRAMHIGTNLGR